MRRKMMTEDYREPSPEETLKEWCLFIANRCTTRIMFGDKKVVSDIFDLDGNPTIGLFELHKPHLGDKNLEAGNVRKCLAMLTFKSRESLDAFRVWLQEIDNALVFNDNLNSVNNNANDVK